MGNLWFLPTMFIWPLHLENLSENLIYFRFHHFCFKLLMFCNLTGCWRKNDKCIFFLIASIGRRWTNSNFKYTIFSAQQSWNISEKDDEQNKFSFNILMLAWFIILDFYAVNMMFLLSINPSIITFNLLNNIIRKTI